MPILQPSQMGLPQGTPQTPTMAPTVPTILQPSQMSGQPQNVAPVAQNSPQTQPQGAQLSNTGSFLGNLGNSVSNFVGSIGNAITHPVQTVENVGKGLIGAGENLASYVTTGKSAAPDQFTQVADNIGNYLTQRYGSLKAAGTTAYQDPVGFLADASALLSGIGGVGDAITDAGTDAGRAAEAAKAAGTDFVGTSEGLKTPQSIIDAEGPSTANKVFSGISNVGEKINPVSLGANVAGKVLSPVADFAGKQVSNIIGAATGAGGSSIREGLNAASEGNNEFIQAARGNISESSIIDTAQQALDNMKNARNTTYQADLQGIKASEVPVDYTATTDELTKQLQNNGITVDEKGNLNFENARGFQNPSEQAVLQNVYNKIQSWQDIPQNNTLYGGDTLKQQLGDYYEQAGSKSGAVIAQVKNVLSDTLKQNDAYKNLVEPYESTSKLIQEVKSDLISKNPETALKKLTKAMSQDNTYRQSLIDELNKYTPNGEDIKAQLAGLNMKSWTNNSKLFTYGEIGTALLNPHLLPTFLASSPRIVAEFLNAAGYSASKISEGLSFLKSYKAATAVNAAGRINKASSSTSRSNGQSSQPSPKRILIKPISA